MPRRPIADYLPQFVEVLQKRGTGSRTVALFRNQWPLLVDHPKGPPCPYCYVKGPGGKMVEQTDVGGVVAMRCAACGEQLILRPF